MEVLSQQPVRVFVRASLPKALRITEVHFHIRGHREALVLGHLQPTVPGQRAPQCRREFPNVSAQRGHDSSRVFAAHLDERGKTRMTFHQCCDVNILGAADEIAFPMTGDGTVLNFRGPFPDGDGIDDLPTAVSARTGLPRAAYTPLGPKVLNQLLFQHSARLNEQAAINRFVGHAHGLVVGILVPQQSGNLFRRPVQDQFTRNDLL